MHLRYLVKNELKPENSTSIWLGPPLVTFGLLGVWASNPSTIPVLAYYSVVLSMFGLVVSLYGIRGLKKLFLPLFAFILIVPLPAFLTRNIISIFHNITTEISLLFIRSVGVSVYNEGNHIDFDGYQIEIDKVTNYETIFSYIVFTYLMILVLDISRKKMIIVVISALCILIFTNSIQVIAASLLHVYLDARTINFLCR
jgi:hypothetical protein